VIRKPNLRRSNKTRYKQGFYTCQNPSKYIGDPRNVIYRSNLELLFFRYLDNNKNVLRWGSEIIKVPYLDITTNKQRTYFVDIYAEYVNKGNSISRTIIEIKPSNQTIPPKGGKYFNSKSKEFMKNNCKWNAARAYAKANGMQFVIMTEEQLR
jgi:hypothetical protein